MRPVRHKYWGVFRMLRRSAVRASDQTGIQADDVHHGAKAQLVLNQSTHGFSLAARTEEHFNRVVPGFIVNGNATREVGRGGIV